MDSRDKYFIAVYTNEVKDYCDEEFFSTLVKASRNNQIHVVDNTIGKEYFHRLYLMLEKYPNVIIHHIDVPREPKISQFQRNVCESVNMLRDMFLKSECDHFLIVESDVLVPKNLLEKFDESLTSMDIVNDVYIEVGAWDEKHWGAIGALYYGGFHDISLKGIRRTHHVLSGCTVYKRELIEKYPFRYDPNELGAFPDALISHDSNKEYSLWNDHDIICEHKHTKYGTRISKAL